MASYIIRRLLYTIPTLLAISVVAFTIIQLPPGDYVTSYAAQLAADGNEVSQASLQALRDRYGLDEPVPVQYFIWMREILFEGDFGQSFAYKRPVADLIWERLALTAVLTLSSLVFIWLVAVPIGVGSARRQYSLLDSVSTFLGFLGYAIPNFLLALVLMWIGYSVLGLDVGGLFSTEYQSAGWGLGKLVDLLSHLWIPMVVLGTAGAASLLRVMRANMLDEISQQYVETARAKGLPERRLMWKYPARVALNPLVSTIGYSIPDLVSGETITAVVLSLPTLGPMLLRALLTQDMYLAGAIVMLVSVLTVICTLLSDILLAWMDPRIRYE
jgi:peptide/nickel transport system permease protein